MSSSEQGWSPSPGEILGVAELVGCARRMLEHSLGDIWVEGEVAELRIPASGHAYFTLADGGCRLRTVCFRNVLRLLDFHPQNGDAVLVRGRLAVYEQRGDLQIVVDHMEPQGAGLQRLRLEQLKRKLALEGLFDPERKQALPQMPRGIAVVTSETGAAVRDILQVLGRRAPWVDVYICPAQVQGDGAPAELCRGLKTAMELEKADLVIIGRGGGGAEDLSAFNDEGLVRLIAASPKPVISAVGHEIDFTLTDLVADLRAPTPSAAAELAVRETGHWVTMLEKAEGAMSEILTRMVSQQRKDLQRLDPSRFHPLRRIERRRLRVDMALERGEKALTSRLWREKERVSTAVKILGSNAPSRKIAQARLALSKLDSAMNREIDDKTSRASQRLDIAREALAQLNPLAVLSRGYSVVRDSDGKPLREATSATVGDRVEVLMHKGSLGCEVKEVKK